MNTTTKRKRAASAMTEEDLQGVARAAVQIAFELKGNLLKAAEEIARLTGMPPKTAEALLLKYPEAKATRVFADEITFGIPRRFRAGKLQPV